MGFFKGSQYMRDDSAIALKLAIGFATADAQALWKVPPGVRIQIERLWWEVTTGFTGGSSSAIGVSASAAPHTAKGDLLGGATGDVAATLVPGIAIGGTIGVSFGSNGIVVLEAGTIVRFDRITSAFTAGAGFVHMTGRQIG